jgi:16S rRNA (cytidine1402-2'-O)-methyltransferase
MTRDGGGVLNVVATPIGNLEDITLRALRVLRESDAVVAEDTRRTRQLLTAHGIRQRLVSLPAHDEQRRVPDIVRRLDEGQSVALCTDAGSPALSDPGAALVRAARAAGHQVTPIPGPSAITAALSASGLPADSFMFLGFLPRTAGKLSRVLEPALHWGRTLVFFESPLRLAKTLQLVTPLLGERTVIVARELTKIHETFHIGTAAGLTAEFAEHPPRGECTVLVSGE